MLFNSTEFIFAFLPVVLTAYWLLRPRSSVAASAFLAAASLFFYWWWESRNLPILLGSIAFNFLVGVCIARASQNAKLVLAFGISVDLVALGYFKYAAFIIENLNLALGAVIATPQVELPIGISFFTFTQIAYLVDIYRRKAVEHDPVNYTLFVSYFPHLIAGPILHHREMMPQFSDRTARDFGALASVGLTIFAIGLFKKTALADPVGVYATPIFNAYDAGEVLSGFEAWVGALAFTLQLYFDFSAYCDMAVGLSLMFGVKLPINFYSPYKSTSIIEFWRRWHMTLSRFLLNYLYIPLGGNRHGPVARYKNLLLTMLLGGLWHGAAWTFVVWGALHGLYLIANHAFRSTHLKLPNVVSWLLTFLAVVIAWVFFKATTVSGALSMLQSMFLSSNWFPSDGNAALIAGLHILVGLVIVLQLPNVYEVFAKVDPALLSEDLECRLHSQRAAWWMWQSPSLKWGFVAGSAFVISLFLLTREMVPSEFLYFQF